VHALLQRQKLIFALPGEELTITPAATPSPDADIYLGVVRAKDGTSIGNARFITGKLVSGFVNLDNRTLRFMQTGASAFALETQDNGGLPDEGPSQRQPGALDDLSSRTPHGTTAPEISLLLFYDDAVKTEVGSALDAFVRDRQAELDSTYSSGSHPAGFRVKIIDSAPYGAVSTSDPSTLLNELSRNAAVIKLRDDRKADLVALVVTTINNACGIGNFYYRGDKARAFSVVQKSCAEKQFSLSHEVGHNLGADHDRDNARLNDPAACNYGFKSPVARKRTVMAYNCIAPQVCKQREPYFSSETIREGTVPMGVDCAKPAPADNMSVVKKTAATIAAYY
jgi:hypothetical protein